MAGHVDNFADKVEPGVLSAFHGFRREGLGRDAAAGHFRRAEALAAGWSATPTVDSIDQSLGMVGRQVGEGAVITGLADNPSRQSPLQVVSLIQQ